MFARTETLIAASHLTAPVGAGATVGLVAHFRDGGRRGQQRGTWRKHGLVGFDPPTNGPNSMFMSWNGIGNEQSAWKAIQDISNFYLLNELAADAKS